MRWSGREPADRKQKRGGGCRKKGRLEAAGRRKLLDDVETTATIHQDSWRTCLTAFLTFHRELRRVSGTSDGTVKC